MVLVSKIFVKIVDVTTKNSADNSAIVVAPYSAARWPEPDKMASNSNIRTRYTTNMFIYDIQI